MTNIASYVTQAMSSVKPQYIVAKLLISQIVIKNQKQKLKTTITF